MHHLIESCLMGPRIEQPDVRMIRLAALMYCANCDAAYESGGPSARIACPACGSRNVCAARIIPVAA